MRPGPVLVNPWRMASKSSTLENHIMAKLTTFDPISDQRNLVSALAIIAERWKTVAKHFWHRKSPDYSAQREIVMHPGSGLSDLD